MKASEAFKEYRALIGAGKDKDEAAKQVCYRFSISRATLNYHIKMFGDKK